MSTNWMKLERTLTRAETRLARRVEAHAWLIIDNYKRWQQPLRTHCKWSVEQMNKTAYPGWYDRTKLYLHYNDVYLLAVESETLVLRLRALKYHGSVVYLNPRYSRVPTVRDYKLNPDF